MHPGHLAALLEYSFPGWRLLATAILMVACMVAVGWLARRSWLAVAVLAGLSLAWLTVDRLWEILVLFSVTSDRGVTLADLVGVAGIGASIWFALRLRRNSGWAQGRDDRIEGADNGDRPAGTAAVRCRGRDRGSGPG